MAETFQTERLIFRPWKEDDAGELYKYAKDPRVGPIAGWSVHTGVENSREIIRNILSEPENYALILKETGKPVGDAGIMFKNNSNAEIGDGEAELGYWIGVPYWGRGLIPEAVKKLLERCFVHFGCTRVWISYYDGNLNSRRVAEKCGFEYSHEKTVVSPLGDERLEHYMCLTKDKWENCKL